MIYDIFYHFILFFFAMAGRECTIFCAFSVDFERSEETEVGSRMVPHLRTLAISQWHLPNKRCSPIKLDKFKINP